MGEFLSEHWDKLAALWAIFYAYSYGKGRQDSKQETHDLSDKATQKTVRALKEEMLELTKDVNKIIEALERTYVTSETCHKDYVSKEMFRLEIDMLKEGSKVRLQSLMELIKVRKDIR